MSLYSEESGNPSGDGQKEIVDFFTRDHLSREEEEDVLLTTSAAKAGLDPRRILFAFHSKKPIVQ